MSILLNFTSSKNFILLHLDSLWANPFSLIIFILKGRYSLELKKIIYGGLNS